MHGGVRAVQLSCNPPRDRLTYLSPIRPLVFTEAMDTLVFLRRLFEEWGYSVTQIDGRMDMPARLRAEDDFHDRCQIMVATEAADEGINLQFCARMINYDLPWVPTRLEQRMGRIHRYGQQRVARIYNLAAVDTREGNVLVGLLDRLEEMRAQRKPLTSSRTMFGAYSIT